MTNWSPQQDKALKDVDHWFKNESKNRQTYRLFGTAGTGKTTLAKHIAENIDGTVKFATFTGKAAHVMASKGCTGAGTIHRLIYRPKAASKAHLRSLEKQLADYEAAPEPDWEAIARIREEVKAEQQNAGRMSFSVNLESELRYAKLLILDEASQVDATMGADLESFGIPILVLGDPEQLPPIYGTGYFTEQKPDTFLDEIHRQALDNPIIQMAQTVRSGKPLLLGQYGNSQVLGERMEGIEMLKHDIVLTGLRKTKKACDDKSRSLLGHAPGLPRKGDRLMCVKNNHMLALLNGQMWEMMADAVSMGGGTVSLHIRNEDGAEMAVCANEKLLLGQALQRWEHEEDIEEFEYSYAITVHKSQGSQWNKVFLFDEKDKFPMADEKFRRRWLYTGITRAAESITVMRL